MKCTMCKIEQPLDNFNRQGKTKRKQCRSCMDFLGLNRHYQRNYGLSIREVQTMHEKQDFCCGICGEKSSVGYHKGLSVDHCHITGIVRGLLCNQCNRGIGYLKEDTKLLRKAISYLEKDYQ